tara:strand:- start:137 stop:1093 length:957 start_codon:yes stop_codon:yes gene_type:complete
MSFSLSGLTDYTAENQFELMTATVLGAKMMSLATVVPNIKGPSKLPTLSQSVIFQDDACSFSASGSTTFTQRTLTPGKVKINDSWCPKDLEPKYLSQEMAAGAHHEAVTPDYVWQAIMNEYTKQIARDIDIAIWKGEDGIGAGNNGHWDGYVTLLSSGTTDADSGNTITDLGDPTQAIAAQKLVYLAAAVAGLTEFDDFRVFVGYDDYAALVSGLMAAGLTYGTYLNGFGGANVDPNSSDGLSFPGTGLRVIPVVGLNGTNKLYAGRLSNFFIGVDAEGDFNSLETWYSQDDRVVKLAMEFKVGVQVAFPAEIITILP